MDDRSDVSTVAAYKCPRCGNEFPRAQVTCDICGFQCSDDACKQVDVSNEGF